MRLSSKTPLPSHGACSNPDSRFLKQIIPALTDGDSEKILRLAKESGASMAAYVFLRLPLEVKGLFVEWLETHYPDRAAHVMSLVRQSRGGRENVSNFGERMEGAGVFADMIRQRFVVASRRLGFEEEMP